MALATYRRLRRGDAARAWRGVLLAAIDEYHDVWTDEKRLTRTGLSRYHGSGLGVPPEVEPGHFDPIYRPHAARWGMGVREFEAAYKAGTIHVPELDAFWDHDAAIRESGHDTTYRWMRGGRDRCADFATVDLNSLLYKVELDLARAIAEEFGGTLTRADGSREEGATWSARAQRRKGLIDEYLWDEQRGMYFDYDVASGCRSDYVSATALYPLWACLADDRETRLMTPERADRLVATALPLLEMPGGLAASAEGSLGLLSASRPARQWDYPVGWPPHQMLAWRGLLNYGLDATAHRLIYRWLYTVARTAADYNGAIVEKYDVVTRSHKVHAEYGNVGADFEYLSREGFGWTNASLQVGLQLLPGRLRRWLERLVAPEFLFESPNRSKLA
jgi:alpha,alpha-trehalase